MPFCATINGMIMDGSIKRILKPDQAAWLTSLQNDMALLTNQDAKKHWGRPEMEGAPYYNARLEHIQQVERDALRLAQEIPADQEILLAAAWIHDRYRPEFEGDQHAEKSAQWAREHLEALGFPPEKVEAVASAIQHHVDLPGVIPESAVEARLLWDADKLAKIGPLNIVSYLCSHPAFPEQKITYSGLALLGLEKLERTRRMAESLYFELARKLARERYEHQRIFYESLARDVDV
jgi:hypothetical protein